MIIILLLASCLGIAIAYKLKHKKTACSCSECTPENCKCEENKCGNGTISCTCHTVIVDQQVDVFVEAPVEEVVAEVPVAEEVKPEPVVEAPKEVAKPVVKKPEVKKPEVKKTPIAKKPQPKVNTKKKPGKK